MTELEELIQKAIDGDSSAYTQLYKLSCRQVYFTCLGFVKNESDAEDLMQETFFTVMLKLPALNDRNSFQAWVNRIAINKCKNFLAKRTNISIEEEFGETGNELSDEEISLPDEYVDDEEKRKIIMDIIMTKLSDVQRQTIIMYYYDEMTTAEIAEEMECPIGTITYRLSSARKAIEKEILKYEEINKDRLHTFLPIPFLTQLFRTEAENLKMSKPDLSSIVPSVVNMSTAAATPGETVHSIGSKVIAAVTAIVFAGGTASYYVEKYHKEKIDTSPGYEYYALLDKEYEENKYQDNFNDTTYWNGEEVYFESMDTNDYFRYNAETNTLDVIIPSSRDVSLEKDGEMVDCTIITQFHSNYFYHDNIYSIGYLKFNENESQNECALIKYDVDGNLEDYFILEGLYHGYNTTERYEQIAINGIMEDGKIYICHAEIQLPYEEMTGTVIQATYYRINSDFTDFEENLDFTNSNDEYYCSDIIYCNGTLYAACSRKEDYLFLPSVYYAFDEKTLEPIEDDFFIQNDIEPSYAIGKYMVTSDAIYDTDTDEIFVNIPASLDGAGYFMYYGGGYHYYISVDDNGISEIKRVRLPSNINYECDGKELADSLESDENIRIEDYVQGYEILDSDTYFIYEPEGTYFCHFSTGEKIKIQFPWSTTE